MQLKLHLDLIQIFALSPRNLHNFEYQHLKYMEGTQHLGQDLPQQR